MIIIIIIIIPTHQIYTTSVQLTGREQISNNIYTSVNLLNKNLGSI